MSLDVSQCLSMSLNVSPCLSLSLLLLSRLTLLPLEKRSMFEVAMFLKIEKTCVLDLLMRTYVQRATPDMLKMSHSIAMYVINSPNQSLKTQENGVVTSTGPSDLFHMITQYVEHAYKLTTLYQFHAKVLSMVTQPVLKYLHVVELRVAQGKIHVYCTCWWYSLCNFQYRSLYEKTCSYNFEC